MIKQQQTSRAEAGFTLVELAVVMIIIGLLIGGVLKGQELIANAQVTATVQQVKAIDGATSTFRDSYAAVPGDMITASTRLPATACGGVVCVNGNGNGQIDPAIGAAPSIAAGAAGESGNFFRHLNAADLLSGYDASAGLVFGQALPTTPAGGGFSIGSNTVAAAIAGDALLGGGGLRTGSYLALTNSAVAATSDATGVVSPAQAARIDRKIDDGIPATGSVQPYGPVACTLAGPPTAYAEATNTALCGLYIRVQS